VKLYCDAHLHSSHPPFPDIETADGLYLSCAAGPDDWETLLDSKKIKPFLGLHPENIDERWEDLIPLLEKLIEQNPDAGIGECGLDKRFYKTVPRILQEEILTRQIKIAEKYRRPVVLHQIGASGALADFLTDLNPEVPLMIHGFKESPEILQRYLKLGMYISLGPGNHWDNQDFLNTAGMIPHEKLLIETDWPYCIHGNQDRPSYSDCLSKHYRTVSAKLGIDISLLCRLGKENGTFFTH
jgi:Tat protein secretion system quality control protein TatD with DNase activity